MIKRYDVIAFSTGILLVFFLLDFAQAQQPPKSVTVGTNPAGTVLYAVAGGLASVKRRRALSSGGPALHRD